MKILIIEDEAPAFRRLQNIIEEINPEIDILEVIASVSEGIDWLTNNNAPDLIFTDIQLNDGISFDIFENVEVSSPVIFVTAFDEYMLKAFRVNSIDYLLKPVKKDDVEAALKKYDDFTAFLSSNGSDSLKELVGKIRMDDRKFKSRFLVKIGEQLIAVETEEISYFMTRNGVVYLHTNDNKRYLVDYKLDEVMSELDPEIFYRANRQYIISFKGIKKVHKYHKGKILVELKNESDEQIIVSSEKATHFKNWLGA